MVKFKIISIHTVEYLFDLFLNVTQRFKNTGGLPETCCMSQSLWIDTVNTNGSVSESQWIIFTKLIVIIFAIIEQHWLMVEATVLLFVWGFFSFLGYILPLFNSGWQRPTGNWVRGGWVTCSKGILLESNQDCYDYVACTETTWLPKRSGWSFYTNTYIQYTPVKFCEDMKQ